MINFRQYSFKKIGCLELADCDKDSPLLNQDKEYLKVIFIKSGGSITIDFQEYELKQDAFFFINKDQHYIINEICKGTMLYYNIDFYCVEIHEKEVACDGILFNNVYEIPIVLLDKANSMSLQNILQQIKTEMQTDDSATEEMLRTFLKQIILTSTRLWKLQHNLKKADPVPEIEFSRKFSSMVEKNYLKIHTVAQYAELLHISPKALNKRITRYSNTTPNNIIKRRVILEAKRLLVHTQLSIKEIS